MIRSALLALLLCVPQQAFAQAQSRAEVQFQDSEQGTFQLCHGSGRITCVVDGDTIWYRGTKIRIADINTPETSQPACAAEAELGARAARRLTAPLNQGTFSLEREGRDLDHYGRQLRIVRRHGHSLGAVLVAEGLAEVWQGRRGNWCSA